MSLHFGNLHCGIWENTHTHTNIAKNTKKNHHTLPSSRFVKKNEKIRGNRIEGNQR